MILSACVHGLIQVYMTSWWTMAYGSDTPKRLQGRSNWPHVVELSTGKLARRTMDEESKFKTASGLNATSAKCIVDLLDDICNLNAFVQTRQERKAVDWKQKS